MPPKGRAASQYRDPKDELQELTSRVLRGNAENFEHMARSVRRSLWTSYAMNIILFGIGVIAFAAALAKGFGEGGTDQPTATTAVFGGLSAASFLTAFVTRPADAVARQCIYASWLYGIINTYWTRLVYFDDAMTVDRDLVAAEGDLVDRLRQLAETSAKHPTEQRRRRRAAREAATAINEMSTADHRLKEPPAASQTVAGPRAGNQLATP